MRAVIRLALLAVSSVLALSLTACSGPACPARPHTDPGRALLALRSMRRPAHVIRAEASVEQWGRDGRIRGTVMMFIQRPASVRFDAMTQFGPAVILTSDGTEFALTDLRENRYMEGPTCPENIALLLGIPMSGADVTLFLLGDSPTLTTEAAAIECIGDGTYLVTLRGENGERQELALEVREWDLDRDAPPDEQRLRLVRSEMFDAGGQTVWRATYDDYRVIPDPVSDEGYGVAMPFKIRFEHPAERADTTVRFTEVDLNVDVPPGAFRQSPRPGIPPETVTCD
jgi:hypothetical protein